MTLLIIELELEINPRSTDTTDEQTSVGSYSQKNKKKTTNNSS